MEPVGNFITSVFLFFACYFLVTLGLKYDRLFLAMGEAYVFVILSYVVGGWAGISALANLILVFRPDILDE